MARRVTSGAAPQSGDNQGFSDRVLVFFVTQVVTAGLVLFNGFFLARLIGPSGKGDYYLLTFLPLTLMVLCQLGLPQAFTFFSARGRTRGLITRALALTALISLPVLAITAVLLPALQATILHGLEVSLIVLPLLALPFLVNAELHDGHRRGAPGGDRDGRRVHQRLGLGDGAHPDPGRCAQPRACGGR